MNRCADCGNKLEDDAVSCPSCGGTAVPESVKRGIQPLFRPGDVLADRFLVERILGSGASGVVYGVHDNIRGARVALKVLWERADRESPAFMRLRREILASQRMPSPMLVSIFDLLFIKGHPALVMEWVEGQTLSDRIRQEGELAWQEAASLARQILGGLSHLHKLGIVHRDIKSSNILIDREGRARLGDFGLVKGEDLGSTLTETGETLGTPGYMAPEVIRGHKATAASDLYSIGVVLFEVLAGLRPFQGSSALEVATRQLNERVPFRHLKAKRVPLWLRKITARLLEQEPKDRLPSADAVLAAIENRSAGFALAKRWRRRTAAIIFFIVCLGAFFGWQRWAAYKAPLDVSFHGKTLEARTPSGRLLWSREMPRAIQSTVFGHFGPDGTSAVACAITWDANEPATRLDLSHANELVVLNRDGSRFGKYNLGTRLNPFEQHYIVSLSSHRFSKSDHEKLVVKMECDPWYPGMVQVADFDHSPDGDVTRSYALDCAFYNSGYILSMFYRDLDGDGIDDIAFTSFNQGLYQCNVVGAARVAVPSGKSRPPAVIYLSPDRVGSSDNSLMFYRCLGFENFRMFRLKDLGLSRPLGIVLPHSPAATLDRSGGLWTRAGLEIKPSATNVALLDSGLSQLCSLRFLGHYQGLLAQSRIWLKRASGAYVWLGHLFEAQALMGLKRYAEAISVLGQAQKEGRPARSPSYSYLYLLQCKFLTGQYEDVLTQYDGIPDWARAYRRGIGLTAMWAALYGGDPEAMGRYTYGMTLNGISSDTELYTALFMFFQGDYSGAGKALQGQVSKKDTASSMPSQWLIASLLREHRLHAAESVMKAAIARFPGDHLRDSEIKLWLDWNAGRRDSSLVSRFDHVLAEKRLYAPVDVPSRALLPVTLARASAIQRAAGKRSMADRLEREAMRLAPSSWRPVLADIAASR